MPNPSPFYEEEFAGYTPSEFGLYSPYEKTARFYGAGPDPLPSVEKDYTPRVSYSAATIPDTIFGVPTWMVCVGMGLAVVVGLVASDHISFRAPKARDFGDNPKVRGPPDSTRYNPHEPWERAYRRKKERKSGLGGLQKIADMLGMK